MAPLSAGELYFLIATLMTLAVLLWLVPSCGDPACSTAHSSHLVKTRAEDIERVHITFHSADRPQPNCSLCQAAKRRDQ